MFNVEIEELETVASPSFQHFIEGFGVGIGIVAAGVGIVAGILAIC